MSNKFTITKAPYIRSVDENKSSTSKMMLDLLIALLPIIIFGFINFGLIPYIKRIDLNLWHLFRPLVNVIIGGLSSVILEGLYFFIFKKIRGFKNLLKEVHLSFSCIPGILLALTLPVTTPLWIIILGCFIANIVFKMLFGGFGHNVFNPALIAYAFVALCFSSTINTAYTEYLELTNISGATPLTNFHNVFQTSTAIVSKETIIDVYGGLWNFFFGLIPGTIGETSTLLCLVGFVYLVVRKVIDWYVPTIYVGTVFIITFVIGIVNGYNGLWFSLFHIFSGGLMFGAVFMATEPVTTPRNPIAKIIYSISIGVLTTLFRLVGSMSGGVATSILFMCLFTPMLDRFCATLRVNKIDLKRGLILSLIVVCLFGVSTYVVAKNHRINPEQMPNNEIEEENSFVIEVKGHNGPIKVEFKYSNGLITSMVPFEHNESVAYSYAVKEAFEKYPDALVNAGDKYNEIENITNATYSCDALKKAYENASKKLKTICLNGYIDVVTDNEIVVLIQGNVNLMKIKFNYDGYDIKSMILEPHDEYSIYDKNVIEALNNYPSKLIESKSEYEHLEIIQEAPVHSKKLKTAYGLVYKYLHERYANGKILKDENNNIELVINGIDNIIKVHFTYDNEKAITSMNVFDQTIELDSFISSLVSAKANYQNVENISGHDDLCNIIKNAYGCAYNYIKGKNIIERVTDTKIITTIKAQNGLIRTIFEYSGTSIVRMKVLQHSESFESEEVISDFENLQLELVKNKYYIDKVSIDINGNNSLKALQTAYVTANNYLLLDKLSNYTNGIILEVDDKDKKITVVVKGHNNPIVTEFTYNDEYEITSMIPIFHGESVAYSPWVKEAFETIPEALVNAKDKYESVENIAQATVSCNALKTAYKIAYDYLKYGVAIESETQNEIKTYVKGHNAYIRIKFEINNEEIIKMTPFEHNESVMYSEPVKNAFETIPGILVDAKEDYDSIENIANASVSINAMKKSYGFVYNYLQGGRK